jgi:hypothetical protein
MAKDNEAILNGEEVSTQSENSVKDVPQAFKDHVLKYGERIENTAPGRLPYYIQDNRKRVDKLLGLNNEPQRTPQEIAAERHANRTEQDKQGIQQAWNESRLNSLQEAINNGYLPEECKARLAELAKLNTPEHFDEFQAQIKTLQAQAQRHAARTPQDIADIKARWEKRVFINDKIRRDADRVLTLAKSYSEVDYAQLEKLIAQGKLAEMDAETQKVLQALKDMREQERALEDLIPDVHKWHKQFTLAELQEAHKSVEDTIAFWQTKYGANLAAGTNLETLQTELEKKIKFVENPGAYKAGAVQSKTWQVKQSAYMKHADQTYQKIKIIKATEQYEELAKFKTTSKDFNLYLQQAKEALDNGDTITANYKLSLANYKKATLEARRKTSVTSIAANFDAADYTEEAKNNAIWCKTAKASHKNWDADSEAAWNGATSGERKGWRDYTAGSGHMNRPLRGYDKNRNPHLKAWAKENFVGVGSVDLDLEGGEANIRNLYNLLERCTFDTNRWLQRGIETWDGFEGFLGFSKPGQSVTREQVRAMVGKEVTDHAFMSCGSAKGTGFNGVILNIYCPKGTKGLYACPHSCYGDYENETILQLGTKFRITKVECPDRGNVYIDLEVIGYEKHPLLK